MWRRWCSTPGGSHGLTWFCVFPHFQQRGRTVQHCVDCEVSPSLGLNIHHLESACCGWSGLEVGWSHATRGGSHVRAACLTARWRRSHLKVSSMLRRGDSQRVSVTYAQALERGGGLERAWVHIPAERGRSPCGLGSCVFPNAPGTTVMLFLLWHSFTQKERGYVHKIIGWPNTVTRLLGSGEFDRHNKQSVHRVFQEFSSYLCSWVDTLPLPVVCNAAGHPSVG